MGVITNEGVIGVVHSVSKNYSLVLSLLHKKAATGIFLKKNMHTGILKWQGFDYRTAVINDLPVHIPLNKGDTIITNSYSNIYPEGVNIGTIANFTKNSDKILKNVRNAGSIFIGEYSPEAIGDYLAGPNHVLPTSGSAKFSSGLSVNDFLKRHSLIKITKTGNYFLEILKPTDLRSFQKFE